ncbi:MAG: hypothetical protein ACLQVM_00775 [Terriglobia bacterium]
MSEIWYSCEIWYDRSGAEDGGRMVPHADRDAAEKDARLRGWRIVAREVGVVEYYQLGETYPFQAEVGTAFD